MGVDVGGWELRNFVIVRVSGRLAPRRDKDEWAWMGTDGGLGEDGKWFTLGHMSGRMRGKRNVWKFVIVEDLGVGNGRVERVILGGFLCDIGLHGMGWRE